MSDLLELWSLDWGDGILLVAMVMLLYTYKVWIDSKFRK